jgi:hypothetical protein
MWLEKLWPRLQAAGVSWAVEQKQKESGEAPKPRTVQQAILERQIQLLGLKPRPPGRLQ